MLVDIPTEAIIEKLIVQNTKEKFAKMSMKVLELEKNIKVMEEEVRLYGMMLEKEIRKQRGGK